MGNQKEAQKPGAEAKNKEESGQEPEQEQEQEISLKEERIRKELKQMNE